jgi:xanthine dehydrogenase YagS FAD-binding subunit
MRPFTYARATDAAMAITLRSRQPNARFLGGGTNLVDLMRENIEQPDALVDITALPLQEIRELADGRISIGAAVKNTTLAANRLIRERYPLLAQAIVCGASGQIRNMATVGGNMMQRTRCCYFYDATANCNKRVPGSGCDAIDGFSRMHAILGASEHCIATHPSDMCVALAALDATVQVDGTAGARTIPFGLFHRLPGDTPHLETALQPDELITSVQIPPLAVAANSMYRKIRDRSSYAFALISVAAAVATSDGLLTDVRIALGGVAHRPWRAREAERILRGGPANDSAFQHAAEAELAAARPAKDNGFKIELARRTIVSVLRELTERGSAQ